MEKVMEMIKKMLGGTYGKYIVGAALVVGAVLVAFGVIDMETITKYIPGLGETPAVVG